MMPRVRFRWVQRGLLLLGFFLLAQWSVNHVASHAFQSAAASKLEVGWREVNASPSGVIARDAAMGPTFEPPKHPRELEGLIGRIEIPRLDITAIIAEGSDVKTLEHAVGHIASTALPGSPGNCALAGHRDTFLRGLGGVRADDLVRIVTLDGTFTYRVAWSEVVEPQRVDVLDSTATRSVTLVTCYPFVFIGHAPQRFVVRATQVEAAAGSPMTPGRSPLRPHERHGVS